MTCTRSGVNMLAGEDTTLLISFDLGNGDATLLPAVKTSTVGEKRFLCDKNKKQ